LKALYLNFHANMVAAGKHNRRKFAIQRNSLKEVAPSFDIRSDDLHLQNGVPNAGIIYFSD